MICDLTHISRVCKEFFGVETLLLKPPTTSESLMTLLNTLMETCATLSQRVAVLEHEKIAQVLKIFKLKGRVKKLEKNRRSKSSGLKRLRKVVPLKGLNPLQKLLWVLVTQQAQRLVSLSKEAQRNEAKS
nr:hypothetical protein [Tanacetum cinerariifolium]